jgi:hypothetical protein
MLGAANVLDVRTNKAGHREFYVSFAGTDKRLDSWVSEGAIGSEVINGNGNHVNGAGPSRPSSNLKRSHSELGVRQSHISLSGTPLTLTPGYRRFL